MINRLPADFDAMAQQLAARLTPVESPSQVRVNTRVFEGNVPIGRERKLPRPRVSVPPRTTGGTSWDRQWRMSPELSYGRHAGPPHWDARRAAVQVLLFLDEGAWYLPLTLRPHHLPRHAGQISFAGGVIDQGEAGRDCAWREWCEELGEPGGTWKWVGRLPSTFVFASNFLVTPYVALSDRRPCYQLNPQEVAEVLEIPLESVVRGDFVGEHLERRGPLCFRAPHFLHAGHRVWGATALILEMLARYLQPAQER
jgi:8-oxo-dGTP pyrophosphatase MutT (NUDIX family)